MLIVIDISVLTMTNIKSRNLINTVIDIRDTCKLNKISLQPTSKIWKLKPKQSRWKNS